MSLQGESEQKQKARALVMAVAQRTGGDVQLQLGLFITEDEKRRSREFVLNYQIRALQPEANTAK